MKDKTVYIQSVMVVFGLLIISRIPSIINGSLDTITIVSTIVELLFIMWGFFVIKR